MPPTFSGAKIFPFPDTSALKRDLFGDGERKHVTRTQWLAVLLKHVTKTTQRDWGSSQITLAWFESPAWNPKQPFINGCFNWMIPNLYIGNGCFTKHLFINGCLGFQVVNLEFWSLGGWSPGWNKFPGCKFFGGKILSPFIPGSSRYVCKILCRNSPKKTYQKIGNFTYRSKIQV